MNLRKLIFTNNACYKAGRTIAVKGVMCHSTGANNPNLKRYVGPDDGLLGQNQYGNHWNQDTPDGRQVCVHGFIGKLADGSIAAYQTLPWNHRGWHCGSGSKGSGNDAYIGIEMCEDGLTDPVYFAAVYNEAAELFAHLCREFNLNPLKDGVIIGHYEGYQRGIASNHGDPKNWMPKFGKSMDTFRADVKKLLDGGATPAQPVTPPTPSTPTGTVQKGSLVKLSADAVYYSGATIPAWVKADTWYISSLSKDRAVLGKNESGKNDIQSPVNVKFLSVVGGASSAPVAFTPYLVKVTTDSLNIRKSAGTNQSVVGAIKDKGTYTIVAEADGSGATRWGKLKSGAGWIAVDPAYVTRV
jgi:N-acetylmuramoyl-L-alanine amidase CwlA